jgi:hypothetical protein
MLCTACLNTVRSTNTIHTRTCLILSNIYIFILVSDCVGGGPSAFIYPVPIIMFRRPGIHSASGLFFCPVCVTCMGGSMVVLLMGAGECSYTVRKHKPVQCVPRWRIGVAHSMRVGEGVVVKLQYGEPKWTTYCLSRATLPTCY